jgi:hypothetical protein
MTDTSLTINSAPQNSASENTDSLPPKLLLHSISKHPWLMPYNRLAIGIVFINVLILNALSQHFSIPLLQLSLESVNNLVLANFTLALLIRQEYVINLLFRIATSAPTSWPLSIRWALGKIYHFGGMHVGGFFSASLWFMLFTSLLLASGLASRLLVLLCVVHSSILVLMMVMALPQIRSRFHNQFEYVARFGGWASLLLFWCQSFLLPSPHPWVNTLVLIVLTVNAALPWFRLKKIAVTTLTPSNHVALSDFHYGVTPFAGSSTSLSRNPLLEWHSFANVPYPGKEGFRLTISRAGDWTGRWIDDKPSSVWVKGIPAAGVGNIEILFKKVIWVATGSGIGPCLPHILANKVASRLVWSTRTPRETYGEAITDEILGAQANAIIWDTKKQGKPDLVKLALKAYQEFDAEAVICISNKKVTWDLVYQLESRGIPAFGAIWDS